MDSEKTKKSRKFWILPLLGIIFISISLAVFLWQIKQRKLLQSEKSITQKKATEVTISKKEEPKESILSSNLHSTKDKTPDNSPKNAPRNLPADSKRKKTFLSTPKKVSRSRIHVNQPQPIVPPLPTPTPSPTSPSQIKQPPRPTLEQEARWQAECGKLPGKWECQSRCRQSRLHRTACEHLYGPGRFDNDPL